MNDLISVIIACRNGVNYVKEAIDSVKRQNMNAEIIVVDDGSTDNTAEYAKSCGATVYSIPHGGLPVARNAGLKNMKGNYVVFLDHDDIMREGTLQKLYEAIQSDSEVEYVQAKVQDFLSPELSEKEKKTLSVRPEPYGGLLTGAYLFKKELFDRLGGFKESMTTGGGVDLMMRLNQENVKTIKLDFVAADRRLHNNNMGRTMAAEEKKDYLAVLRAKLAAKK